jgi:phospholipid/cholesterol/gamma-HCH transport system substrate-binding protein
MSRTIRLGVFIVGTLTFLAAGVFLIGDRQFLFSSTYQLNANFKNVSGLSDGAEVRVGGIRTGTVKHIRFPADPNGELIVVMSLRDSTKRILREDSVARIETEGLLGDKYVEISFGTQGAPAVRDGGTIQSVPPFEMADVLKKTNDVLSNLQETSDHVKDISDKINKGQGSVGALINDKKLYTQAMQGATALNENMEALKHNFFLRGFFNRRGYESSADLAENEVTKLPQGSPTRVFHLDPKKSFDEDSAKLRNEKALKEVGQYLESNSFRSAVIVVAGGPIGDKDDVRELTRARGMVIRDYLVDHFKIDDARVKKMGLGKEDGPKEGSVEIRVYQTAQK